MMWSLASALYAAPVALVAQAPPVTLPGGGSFHPGLGGLPGSAVLQNLADGIGGWAVILALVGVLVGAAIWALGAHSQNYHQSVAGRRAVLVSGAAALVMGAAPGIVTFFYGAGHAVTGAGLHP
ncbi:MAG: DUF6112 family protein [Acidimicrobiales bacterium]